MIVGETRPDSVNHALRLCSLLPVCPSVIQSQSIASANRASTEQQHRYCSSAYSAFACFRMVMSGSASFQSETELSQTDPGNSCTACVLSCASTGVGIENRSSLNKVFSPAE